MPDRHGGVRRPLSICHAIPRLQCQSTLTSIRYQITAFRSTDPPPTHQLCPPSRSGVKEGFGPTPFAMCTGSRSACKPGCATTVGAPGAACLERPEQAAAAIRAARCDVRIGIVAKPIVMASVEVVRVAAATEVGAGIAVAIMNFHGAFASRNALGIIAAESECIAQ